CDRENISAQSGTTGNLTQYDRNVNSTPFPIVDWSHRPESCDRENSGFILPRLMGGRGELIADSAWGQALPD
ncbi:MAG: hypothetical protein ACLFT9_06935, partial [Coleofasciculus sp.]